MITRIREALNGNDNNVIKDLYFEAFGSHFNHGCTDCWKDARIRLEIKLNELLNEQSEINLIIAPFQSENTERQKELDFCLNHNKENAIFSNVITVTDSRPTFDDLFEITRGYPDHINVIANSDIFFNDTLIRVKQIKKNECYALTRWDLQKDGTANFLNREDSQDVWIFRGGVDKRVHGNFYLGKPGCDNRIAHELRNVGYILKNPSLTIQVIHYHLSNHRSFKWGDKDDTIPLPYLFVKPSA